MIAAPPVARAGALSRRVLYAHPDRWTINAEFPPEERVRMREGLAGFAAEWLAWKRTVKLSWHAKDAALSETDAQEDALREWRARATSFGRRARRISAGNARGRGRGTDIRPLLLAAVDAVVTGALWESPLFTTTDSRVSFHRAWRLVLEFPPADEPAVAPLARRWHLLPRPR